MSKEAFMIQMILGIFIIFISYQIGWKGNIRLIHSYHYINIAQNDIPIFTKKMGIGGMFVGIGIFFMPILNLVFHGNIGYYIALFSTAVGMIIMLWTILKYNGALIAFRRKK